jgi:hypothetical protein
MGEDCCVSDRDLAGGGGLAVGLVGCCSDEVGHVHRPGLLRREESSPVEKTAGQHSSTVDQPEPALIDPLDLSRGGYLTNQRRTVGIVACPSAGKLCREPSPPPGVVNRLARTYVERDCEPDFGKSCLAIRSDQHR